MKAIITGATSGLGKEVATQLQSKGYNILNLSRTKSNFDNICVDLSDNYQITKCIAEIKSKHADFNLLVLNAGFMPVEKIGSIKTDIDKLFQVNITASIKLVNELLELIKKNHADIVVVGSTSSFTAFEDHGAYTATKHAVDGFVKSLQLELKNEDVRVIGFNPGGFNSNLRGGLQKDGYMNPADLAKLMIQLVELPRLLEVSNILISRKKRK